MIDIKSDYPVSSFDFHGYPVRAIKHEGRAYIFVSDMCDFFGISTDSISVRKRKEAGQCALFSNNEYTDILLINVKGANILSHASRTSGAKAFRNWLEKSLPKLMKDVVDTNGRITDNHSDSLYNTVVMRFKSERDRLTIFDHFRKYFNIPESDNNLPPYKCIKDTLFKEASLFVEGIEVKNGVATYLQINKVDDVDDDDDDVDDDDEIDQPVINSEHREYRDLTTLYYPESNRKIFVTYDGTHCWVSFNSLFREVGLSESVRMYFLYKYFNITANDYCDEIGVNKFYKKFAFGGELSYRFISDWKFNSIQDSVIADIDEKLLPKWKKVKSWLNIEFKKVRFSQKKMDNDENYLSKTRLKNIPYFYRRKRQNIRVLEIDGTYWIKCSCLSNLLSYNYTWQFLNDCFGLSNEYSFETGVIKYPKENKYSLIYISIWRIDELIKKNIFHKDTVLYRLLINFRNWIDTNVIPAFNQPANLDLSFEKDKTITVKPPLNPNGENDFVVCDVSDLSRLFQVSEGKIREELKKLAGKKNISKSCIAIVSKENLRNFLN